ncbi:hypothetical protein [Spirosoma aerolatum]|uniref:hypothetical protein n=1 Tax=Spirosoma aerolatum TaxID=1211326 RepID=UPI0009AE378F|nr:hypothetical protein [Spirosoma aerolatum]
MIYILRTIVLPAFLLGFLGPGFSLAQNRSVRQAPLQGYFLADSVEIGRPFQYSLTYRHPAIKDVLFPDTGRHFSPYQVQKVVVFPTQTTGTGVAAVSRDSAVYTLISFETDTIQRLQVPIRVIGDADCTQLWSRVDSVFLRSKLLLAKSDSVQSQPPKLATETDLATLQQQFNYLALVTGFSLVGLVAFLVYLLLGRTITQQWKLYQLNRQHLRFLSEYNRFCRNINSYTASETANQAIVLWKFYLERLDSLPYTSMTTPELAEQMADNRVTDALREADRMIYGGSFSPQSQPALRLLGEIATQTYRRARTRLQLRGSVEASTNEKTTEPSSIA